MGNFGAASSKLVPPRGLEDLWEINGLVFNDRTVPDCYRLLAIDGARGGADVRDSREPNPSKHGETPYDQLYSGRPLALRGRIEAGNIPRLREMQDELDEVVVSLGDKTLVVRRHGGYLDDWSVASQLNAYTFDAGSGTVSVSDGKLLPSSTAQKRFHRPETFTDVEVQCNFDQIGTGVGDHGVILRRLDSNNYIYGHWTGTTLEIRKVDGGVDTSLKSKTVVAPPNQPVSATFWVMMSAVGDLLSLEARIQNPKLGTLPDDVVSYKLTGVDATKFGTGIVGNVGIRWIPAYTSQKSDDFEVRKTPRIYSNVKITQRLDSPEEQTDLHYRRPFLLTLRSANSRWRSLHRRESLVEVPVSPLKYSSIFTFHDNVNPFTADTGMGANVARTAIGEQLRVVDDNVGGYAALYDASGENHQDADVTVRDVLGLTGKPGIIVKRISSGNYLVATLSILKPPDISLMRIGKVDGGVYSDFVTAVKGTIIWGKAHWMRLWIGGSNLTFELFDDDPFRNGKEIAQLDYTMVGADATKFGTSVTGKVGLFYQSQSGQAGRGPYAYFDDFLARDRSGSHPSVTIRNDGDFEDEPLIRVESLGIGELEAPDGIPGVLVNETLGQKMMLNAMDGLNETLGRDEFDQTAGALTGKTAPIGGVWAGAGDTDDYSVETTGKTAQRTAVSDTSGRIDTLNLNLAATTVQVDMKWSAAVSDNHKGVVARFADSSNFLRATVIAATSTTLRVNKHVAGVVTQIGSQSSLNLGNNTFHTILLTVDAAGNWFVWAWEVGTERGAPRLQGTDIDLATGGALANGDPGIYDEAPSATAVTRNYDNFKASRTIETSYTDIDVEKDTIITSDGADRFDVIDSNSDFITIGPGDNVIRLYVGKTPTAIKSKATFFSGDAWV